MNAYFPKLLLLLLKTSPVALHGKGGVQSKPLSKIKFAEGLPAF
jgi:hypothetical protein